MNLDSRRHAPATARNRDPILDVLRRVLPRSGLVLEIASGTGEHAAHFAAALPHLMFQPSDRDPERRASIDAWSATANLPNLRHAIALDAAADWTTPADAILCINMIHIAPWSATEGLIRGAARALGQGAALFLYGPFRREGAHTADSNAAFDADLRARNPAWGIRDLETVAALAATTGFGPPEITAMPANNLSVIFRRSE